VPGSDAEQDAARDAFITPIKQLLDDGHKIEAIKLYREQTGAALREAKEAVDAIEHGEPGDVKEIGPDV
jgi:ribosomal protein L7/L12